MIFVFSFILTKVTANNTIIDNIWGTQEANNKEEAIGIIVGKVRETYPEHVISAIGIEAWENFNETENI